ncbi:MAG: translation elongation factor Ts [Myxococcota bacterium]|jgi:elongation factor Ts|nr:translation elongation factor Ts [Myxococcota bacterium]
MAISMEMVKELRERTGAGIVDCKNILAETNGDIEKAVQELQKRGIAKAAKKAGRIAAEGLIGHYIHMGGRVAVLCEINCETDFVSRGDDFRTLCEDVSMQIAAMNPLYVRTDEIPAEDLARQTEIFTAQVIDEGKPANIAPKIVDGKLAKWKKEVCLVDQIFIKDDQKTINDLVTALTAKTGEKIAIRRFARFEVGEGLAKRENNLAAEVAAMQG